MDQNILFISNVCIIKQNSRKWKMKPLTKFKQMKMDQNIVPVFTFQNVSTGTMLYRKRGSKKRKCEREKYKTIYENDIWNRANQIQANLNGPEHCACLYSSKCVHRNNVLTGQKRRERWVWQDRTAKTSLTSSFLLVLDFFEFLTCLISKIGPKPQNIMHNQSYSSMLRVCFKNGIIKFFHNISYIKSSKDTKLDGMVKI